MFLDKGTKLRVCLAKDRELILKKFRRAIVLDCAHFLPVSCHSMAVPGKFSAEWCPTSSYQFNQDLAPRFAAWIGANCPSSQPPGHKYGHSQNPLSGQAIEIKILA